MRDELFVVVSRREFNPDKIKVGSAIVLEERRGDVTYASIVLVVHVRPDQLKIQRWTGNPEIITMTDIDNRKYTIRGLVSPIQLLNILEDM